MSDERYIDPNSGAAPQPGGFVAGGAYSVPQGMAAFESGEDEAKDGEQSGDDQPDLTEPQADPEPADDNANSDDEAKGTDDQSGDEAKDVAPVPAATPEDVQGPVDKATETQAYQPDGDPDEPSGGEDSPEAKQEAAEEAQREADGADADAEQEQGGKYDELLSGNVGPVKKHMDEHPDEVEAIKAEEARGKNRAGIVGYEG